MKSITTKLLILIGGLTICILALILYFSYSVANKQTIEVIKQQASLALNFDLAIRGYIGGTIRPIMYQLTDENEFIVEAMSTTYVARSIFEEVRKEFPDYIIKFSSDNPRNPINLAGPEELKVIERFNDNPNLKRWEGIITISGKKFMATFNARRMKKSCLYCHGDPKDAPASMIEKYGSEAGFNREIGKVIGMDTVAIPMNKITEKLWYELKTTLPAFIISILLFFGVVIVIIKLLVINRLVLISKHFRSSAEQTDYSQIKQIDIQGKDEIFDLAFAYNTLTDKLKGFYLSLDHKVKQRTQSLEVVNKKLLQKIDEKNEIEKSLRESQDRFKALHNASFGGIAIHDKGLILDCNQGLSEMTGYSATELVGMDGLLLIAEKSRDLVLGNIVAGYEEAYEAIGLRKNSEEYPIRLEARSIPYKGKQVRLVEFRDITQEKVLEGRYKSIIQTALDGFMLTDARGRILEVNGAYCQMSGYSEAELIQMSIQDLELNETPEEVKSDIRKIKRSGKKRFESRHCRKDGSIIDVDVTVQYRESDTGQFVSFIKDITAQKKQDKALQLQAMLLDQIQDHITATDLEGNIIYVNEAECSKQKRNRSDLIGNSFESYGENAEKGATQEEIIQATVEYGEWRGEVVKHDTYGNEYILDCRTKLIKDDSGTPISMVGIATDITEQKKLAERLQQAQKMESIGSLAGGIAHDFNNLLFPIIGMSELLLEDLPHGSIERENAEEIFKAGKRGSALVKQILAFSRQSEHQMAPIRIQNILKEVLKLSRSTIPSDIEIKQDIQSDCGLIMADATQIHQVAMNLVTNAFHAVEPNGGEIFVSLKEKFLKNTDLFDFSLKPGNYAILSVSDTGVGIPPEIINKIFDPYFTTKEQGKGTGLGLAVVHGIIQEHRGTIKFNTEIGKGTTFDVYIPLMEKANTYRTNAGSTDHPVGNEHILLVDDEESIAKLEKQMLERLGYQVTIRNSSPDALQAFRFNVESFDLVITDMTMPNMTGDKLAKEMIALRPDLPIIICTGFSERIDQEKAEAFGIKGFLMKPVVKSDLAQMVRKVLDEAQKTQ